MLWHTEKSEIQLGTQKKIWMKQMKIQYFYIYAWVSQYRIDGRDFILSVYPSSWTE